MHPARDTVATLGDARVVTWASLHLNRATGESIYKPRPLRGIFVIYLDMSSRKML
jgi:hypothetical protein